MPKNLERALVEALMTSFENMAFTFIDPDAIVEVKSDDPSIETARLEFSSEERGRWSFRLSVSRALLPEIAANMLGLPDPGEVSPDDALDALKELTNVVCGNFLPSIAGSTMVWNVGPPDRLQLSQRASSEDDEKKIEVAVALDGGVAIAACRAM